VCVDGFTFGLQLQSLLEVKQFHIFLAVFVHGGFVVVVLFNILVLLSLNSLSAL
jgi:hypothetical protein